MSIMWSFIGFGPFQWDKYTHDFYLYPSKPEGIAQAASAAMALFVLGGTASPGNNPTREVGRGLIGTAVLAFVAYSGGLFFIFISLLLLLDFGGHNVLMGILLCWLFGLPLLAIGALASHSPYKWMIFAPSACGGVVLITLFWSWA